MTNGVDMKHGKFDWGHFDLKQGCFDTILIYFLFFKKDCFKP